MFSTIIVLCLVSTAFAQIPGFGSCPNSDVHPNFDISKYSGIWYDSTRFFTSYPVVVRCNGINYTAHENGTVTLEEAWPGNYTAHVGTARVPNASEPAKLKIKLTFLSPLITESDYWVLETDYNSFSVVIICSNSELSNFQFAWILTRERNPDASVIAKADEVIAKTAFNRSKPLDNRVKCEMREQ